MSILLSQTREFYSGPLPPPDTLHGYEELLPGAAERIFSAFERQASHRQAMEVRVINHDIRQSRLGLAAGFIVAMTIAVGGLCVAMYKSPTAGATIMGLDLAGLAGVFVTGTWSRKSEREGRKSRNRKQ